MPDSWDPVVYRKRAEQWRRAAEALKPGPTRDAYLELAVGYEKLAELVEKEPVPPSGETGVSLWGRPDN
jgi:hypothetical protein